MCSDQFVHALTPVELRLHVQLTHLVTLGQALELALERETAICATKPTNQAPVMAAAAAKGVLDQTPAWAEELITAMKTLSVWPKDAGTLPGTCWGCGKPGHTLRRCPEAKGQQGNEQGSV